MDKFNKAKQMRICYKKQQIHVHIQHSTVNTGTCATEKKYTDTYKAKESKRMCICSTAEHTHMQQHTHTDAYRHIDSLTNIYINIHASLRGL